MAGILKLIDHAFHPKFAQRNSEKYLRSLDDTTIHSDYFNNPDDAGLLSLFDMEGQPFVITQSDRTGGSRMLTGIDDVMFDNPVLMRGGQDFMQDNDAVWASGVNPINDIYRVAEHLKKQTGKDPMLMPWRMAPTGSDFSNMTYETMLEYAKSNMNKRQKADLNRFMKANMEGWKGIDNPESVKAFGELKTSKRKSLQKDMDKYFRDDGGLSYSKARLAIADPNQFNSKVGNLQNVGLIDLASGIRPSDHPAYPLEILGEMQGRFTEEVPAYLLEPRRLGDLIDNNPARAPLNALDKIHPDDRRVLEMGAMGGVITDKHLKKLEKLIAAGVLGGAGSVYADNGEQPQEGTNFKDVLEFRKWMQQHQERAPAQQEGRMPPSLGSIEAPKEGLGLLPKIGMALEQGIDTPIGNMGMEGMGQWANKMAYGDDIDMWDRLMAAMDVI